MHKKLVKTTFKIYGKPTFFEFTIHIRNCNAAFGHLISTQVQPVLPTVQVIYRMGRSYHL